MGMNTAAFVAEGDKEILADFFSQSIDQYMTDLLTWLCHYFFWLLSFIHKENISIFLLEKEISSNIVR